MFSKLSSFVSPNIKLVLLPKQNYMIKVFFLRLLLTFHYLLAYIYIADVFQYMLLKYVLYLCENNDPCSSRKAKKDVGTIELQVIMDSSVNVSTVPTGIAGCECQHVFKQICTWNLWHTSKVCLFYVALSMTSTQLWLYNQPREPWLEKTSSVRRITKHVRPVVTEALGLNLVSIRPHSLLKYTHILVELFTYQ